jgi:hypothetical protein
MYVHETVLLQGRTNMGQRGGSGRIDCAIGVSKCRDLSTGEAKAYKKYSKQAHQVDIR